MRSERAINERLEQITNEIFNLRREEGVLKDKLVKLKSKKKFTVITKDKSIQVPYSEITLLMVNDIRRGLGYEDDHDVFYEYQFYFPELNVRVRFATDTIMRKYDIPMGDIERYGRKWSHPTDSGEEAWAFRKKFKDVQTVYRDNLNDISRTYLSYA